MSKGKKVIHVDKVIIKADEVVVIDERKHRRDPWGFFGDVNEDRFDDHDKERKFDRKVDDDRDDKDDDRKGFSWV
jgi:hypothetical protein